MGDPFRRADVEESPEAICDLLDKYIKLFPYIMPETGVLSHSVLWHPDLSRANILITPDGNTKATPRIIRGIIDWQSTICAPVILQAEFPRAFKYKGDFFDVSDDGTLPEKPHNFDELTGEDRDECLAEWNDAVLHTKLAESLRKNPIMKAALGYENRDLLELLPMSARTWSMGSVWFAQNLQHLELSARHACPDRDIPVVIPDEDLERHNAEYKKMSLHAWNRNHFEEKLDIEGDGWVEHDNYEKAKSALAQIRREEWTEEAERKIGPWPFQDGAYKSDE